MECDEFCGLTDAIVMGYIKDIDPEPLPEPKGSIEENIKPAHDMSDWFKNLSKEQYSMEAEAQNSQDRSLGGMDANS